MAAALQFPFTSAQWKELERQAMIYKYMMASIPVPTHLLFPLSTNFPADSTNRGVDLYGWRYSSLAGASNNSKDAEPGRCKRTDGKKWRCSRDVAPNQKYCERHMHRGRPRSRKHVEVQPLLSQNNHYNGIINSNKKAKLNNTNSQQMVETPVQSNGASLFGQQYEGEGMNLFSYTDPTGVRDVNSQKQTKGGCDYRNKDGNFLSSHSWIPFASDGGPLAEMLHSGGAAATTTPTNPGSSHAGKGDSVSHLSTNISPPSGVQHRAPFN